jgi:predicted esterase
MRRGLFLLCLAVTAVAEEPPRGALTESVVTRADPEQSYTLFLPSTYDAAKKHPLLLVFDPRSRGTFAAEIYRDAAEEFGWIILSSNGTRSDEGPERNQRALKALLPEVGRYSADPKRVYAAGFSGTAMLAWFLGVQTGELAGVIGVGGRLVDELPPAKFSFASSGFAGDADFNNRDMRAIDAILEREGKTHRFREFPGGHRWITPELAVDALGWFELLAMKEGKRARDEKLISRLFERDNAAAASASPLDAIRIHRAIARDYEGLRDVSEARAALARLERDPNVRRAIEDEARWDRYEERFTQQTLGRVGEIYAELRQSEPRTTSGDVRRQFRIAELVRHAGQPGAEGRAGRRMLESVYTQLSFSLMSQLMERKEYSLAAVTLAAAAEIHPEHWTVWYNLGSAQARAGERRHALDSLEKAVALGFKDAKHLLADEDYASVRNDSRFKAVILALPSQ